MATSHRVDGQDFVPTYHHDTYEYIKPEQFDLGGRAVLVTGASQGLGRETALSFAKAGVSHIAIGARSPLQSLKSEIEAAAQKTGRETPKVLCLPMDVSDYTSVEKASKEVENAFGTRLDILVNNAGYLEPFQPLLESTIEDWTRAYQVNVFGVYYVTRAFLPLMLKTSGGLKTVLNTSSVGAHMTGGHGGSAYRPAKLAVSRFSEFIGWDYPEILSYSIHPGGVLTDLAKQMGKAMEHVLVDSAQLGADSTVWLTAERRDWLQGRYVSVNWDMSELLEKRSVIEKDDLLKVRLRVD